MNQTQSQLEISQQTGRPEYSASDSGLPNGQIIEFREARPIEREAAHYVESIVHGATAPRAAERSEVLRGF
jgi:hypothetical protein